MDALKQVINFGPGPAKLPHSVRLRRCAWEFGPIRIVHLGGFASLQGVGFQRESSNLFATCMHAGFRSFWEKDSGRMHLANEAHRGMSLQLLLALTAGRVQLSCRSRGCAFSPARLEQARNGAL